MTSLTFDVDKIEKIISNGKHEIAALEIFGIIELETNNEIIYKCLNLLNLICDKTPSISLRTISYIKKFISNSDSWIRLVSLEILYQISFYRPNLLLELIEKIRIRLFDQDPSIRRMTVKILGNLILSLHIDMQEVIDEFTERLLDDDWKVKFQVIKTLTKILNQDLKKINDFEPLLSMVIINLRNKDEDVARASAELLKILGTFFLSKEKVFYVLLNLLYNEEPRVKELIIWLFGEIGKEKSSEIIPIIPKLINLLKEDDYRIQAKVLDALVSIAENNFEQILSYLTTSLNTNEHDFRNNLINTIYAISQKNIDIIFPYLFDQLENPSKNIQEAFALVLKRLYEEYPIEVENEITRINYHLESKYWRERKNTIQLLRDICLILKNEKLAIWISIILNKTIKNDMDSDIRMETELTLNDIKITFKDIERKIQKTNYKLYLLNKKIRDFQKLPAQFRNKLNSYIEDFKFNETELLLNKMYGRIQNKITKFHNKINNFEYKRLAFDLIEDWEDTKSQIIDELTIIKGFINKIYEDKKAEYLNELKKNLKVHEDKINILKAQYDYIKEYDFILNIEKLINKTNQDEKALEDKFANLTQMRRNLFNLDVNIRELLIYNLEFKDFFKDMINLWIKTKFQIQSFLNELDVKLKKIKDHLINEHLKATDQPPSHKDINEISNILAFQLLQSHIQSVILDGIEVFKGFNENFDEFNSQINLLLKKKDFSNAKKLIDMKSNQIQTFISETDNQIENIIGNENVLKNNHNVFNLFIRPSINKWNSSKEALMNKLNYFNRKFKDDLYLSQFKYYLKIMNPIRLDLLSSYVGLDKENLKELILKYFNKNKLNAKIVNNYLYSQNIESYISNNQDLLFFKNIKTMGNKIFLNFKLNNPSDYDYKDLQISLKTPNYLKYLKKESFPLHIYLSELKTGNVFKFQYALKIEKGRIQDKNVLDPSADEIKLNLYYKDIFDLPRKTTKKINLLMP